MPGNEGYTICEKPGVAFQIEQRTPLFNSIFCARLFRGKDKDKTISGLGGGDGVEVMEQYGVVQELFPRLRPWEIR